MLKAQMKAFNTHLQNLPLTPPKTSMEPEIGPQEKEIPIGNHLFQLQRLLSREYYSTPPFVQDLEAIFV